MLIAIACSGLNISAIAAPVGKKQEIDVTAGKRFHACFKEASRLYDIDASLLEAIAHVESSMNPKAISNVGAMGLMQIHPSWISIFNKRGYRITEAQIWEPCTNVKIGAWILKANYKEKGKNWNAIGAYNAACTKLKGPQCWAARNEYIQKVYHAWTRLQK